MPEPVRRVFGKAAPLEMDDVDTDQIIPAQFLKVLTRKGLGKYLFYRWRYDENGRPREGFILDRPEFRDSVILVAGRNFGIGSSRENAVWALMDFGIKCVIASSFGDIFYGNSVKNGLLCIRLDDETVRRLRVEASKGNLTLDIDVESEMIRLPSGEVLRFRLEPNVKSWLLEGLDEIEATFRDHGEKIREYEAKMKSFKIPRRAVLPTE
ncbi:MAG: 3-isopropylmalate dehydratase small subunit [Nitrososphaerota archaeon]|nr:3-isopropylmalate dehydratase small subunit [Candidatus Calditenuaceae archaeon]MDW8073688.1 3-isopropylmalate dehydratase small subunit [Nitrososphaerota archaeon]